MVSGGHVVDVAPHDRFEAVANAHHLDVFETAADGRPPPMTLLIPGAGPPPTRIAVFLL